MDTVYIKILNEDAAIPSRESAMAAGYDIRSIEDTEICPGEIKMISTGIAINLPLNSEAQIRPRSGLAIKHGITVINSPGTIDCDYTGEIKVGLINHSKTTFNIKKGDRIAQMVIAKTLLIQFKVVKELIEYERGAGGIGHTGI